MLHVDSALTALFRKEFEWCKVKPGESVAVLTEAGSNPHYVVATLATLAAMGAKTFQLTVPVVPDPERTTMVARGTGFSTILGSVPGIVDLLQKTDMMVDLTVEGQIHSPETKAILKGGSRILFIKEPPDALARLLPTADRTRRIFRSAELIRGAKEMTVTSKAGTKLRVNVGGALISTSCGFCDQPGQWANWGNGMTAAYPPSLEMDGDVVLAPGDIIFPFKKYVESRVLLRFRDAFVQAVEGDGLDADLMRDYMERWNDRNAYGISHVGWGLNERALWHALTLYRKEEMIGVDGRSFEGNFLISTGPNHAAGRRTLCHFDLPMRNCSIFLDGKPIVIEGSIVEPTITRAA
jgi:2,5-dihydroxypyridine 5,6-dioxygenase